MKLKLIGLVSLCLLIAACQKRKYPDDKVQLEKEEIFFNGYFDNQPVSLKIGTDGYYCYASYKQRPDSIYVFEGDLKRFNCNPCPQSLRLELSDYKKSSPGASVIVDESFKAGSRVFLPLIDKPHTIKFESYSNKEISSVRWEFSNSAPSEKSIQDIEFGQPGQQTISLTVKTKGNCESKVVNKIYVGGENGFFACSIATSSLQNNKTQFKADTLGGKPPLKYSWSFGDGNTSNLPAPDHEYAWAGSYPVKLQVTDAENHVCESNFIHVAGNDKSSCTANMSLLYMGSRNAALSGVKIQWTDESNVILRSDNIAQPAGSYFEIINSQPYEPNEKGESGRLLTVRFNVLLSGGGRKIWFKSENTAIAVTYK